MRNTPRIPHISPPLEHSPTEFAEALRDFAVTGELLPRPEGSPLLEFVRGDLVLYVIDRCGPYLPTGPCRMVLHALINPRHTELLPHSNDQPYTAWLEAVERSQVRGAGQVVAQRRQGTVIDTGAAGLLILSCPALPPYTADAWAISAQIGDWLEFETLPPIHGYWLPPEYTAN